MLFTGFSFGCLIVLFLVVLRDFRHLAVARTFLLLLVCAGAFLSKDLVSPEWQWLNGDIMTALPAVFWLLCQLAFSRRPKVVSAWGALCLYSFVAPALARPFGGHEVADTVLYWLGVKLPQFSEYIVISHGLWITIANWRDDLIASRRQLRLFLLATVGIAGLCVTISLNTGHGSWLVVDLSVSISLLVACYLLLKGRDGALLGAETRTTLQDKSRPKASQSVSLNQDRKDDELKAQINKLEYLMEDEKFYRTENLTLRILSKRIGLPEYKTRALINDTFKYRNFNDYVNQLRIEEACERLSVEHDTPVQNIALDVGYRTLSSFNRAFKEIMNQTPTQYRHAKIEVKESQH